MPVRVLNGGLNDLRNAARFRNRCLAAQHFILRSNTEEKQQTVSVQRGFNLTKNKISVYFTLGLTKEEQMSGNIVEKQGALTLTYNAQRKLIKAVSHNIDILTTNPDGTINFDTTRYSKNTEKHQALVKSILGLD